MQKTLRLGSFLQDILLARRQWAWLGIEETDSSHFIRYLHSGYHGSSQLITEQGISNYSESVRLQWWDTPRRNWEEEGKNFQRRAFVVTLKGGSQEAPFHFPQSSTCTPSEFPKDSIFHLPGELMETEEWASFLIVKVCRVYWIPQSGTKCWHSDGDIVQNDFADMSIWTQNSTVYKEVNSEFLSQLLFSERISWLLPYKSW